MEGFSVFLTRKPLRNIVQPVLISLRLVISVMTVFFYGNKVISQVTTTVAIIIDNDEAFIVESTENEAMSLNAAIKEVGKLGVMRKKLRNGYYAID